MLTIAGLLVCLAISMLAVVAPIFRRSDPPRWTTRGWVGEAVTLVIVCTLAIGLGYLGAGVIHAVQTGVDLLDLALLAAVVLITVVVWRHQKGRIRTTAVAAVAAAPAKARASGVGVAATTAAVGPASAGAPPSRAA